MQDFELQNHVSQQLPFRGVGEGTGIGKLVNLAEIVQDNPGEQEVQINSAVILDDQPGRLDW